MSVFCDTLASVTILSGFVERYRRLTFIILLLILLTLTYVQHIVELIDRNTTHMVQHTCASSATTRTVSTANCRAVATNMSLLTALITNYRSPSRSLSGSQYHGRRPAVLTVPILWDILKIYIGLSLTHRYMSLLKISATHATVCITTMTPRWGRTLLSTTSTCLVSTPVTSTMTSTVWLWWVILLITPTSRRHDRLIHSFGDQYHVLQTARSSDVYLETNCLL